MALAYSGVTQPSCDRQLHLEVSEAAEGVVGHSEGTALLLLLESDPKLAQRRTPLLNLCLNVGGVELDEGSLHPHRYRRMNRMRHLPQLAELRELLLHVGKLVEIRSWPAKEPLSVVDHTPLLCRRLEILLKRRHEGVPQLDRVDVAKVRNSFAWRPRERRCSTKLSFSTSTAAWNASDCSSSVASCRHCRLETCRVRLRGTRERSRLGRL